MSIKPMPLINPRHFLKFHNLCPFHKSQPSHRNSRPLPTLCEMTLLIAVCVCLSGCSFTSNGIYGYTQSASRRTAEKKEALFEKRGERLYRAAISGIWYPFGWESPYLFVDIGAEHPVMLTSGKTFDYPTESGEKIQTCMECEVYYHNNGEDIFLGALESLNTGCPIAYDETGIYVAGAHGVEKYVIDESGAAPCLRMEIGSYRSEAGLYRSDTVNSTLSKNEYNRLYADYLSAKIIDYGDVLPFLYKYADEEIELLQLLEKEADCKITDTNMPISIMTGTWISPVPTRRTGSGISYTCAVTSMFVWNWKRCVMISVKYGPSQPMMAKRIRKPICSSMFMTMPALTDISPSTH